MVVSRSLCLGTGGRYGDAQSPPACVGDNSKDKWQSEEGWGQVVLPPPTGVGAAPRPPHVEEGWRWWEIET